MTADFDPDELASLRQLFADEADDLLEVIATRALAAGPESPSPEAIGEMLRGTHTLKGAAGAVALDAVVDLAHRVESALLSLQAGLTTWSIVTSEHLSEITDGLRAVVHAEVAGEEAGPEIGRLRTLIELMVSGRSAAITLPPSMDSATDSLLPEQRSGPHLLSPPTDRSPLLRIEARRIDELMNSTGELLFDRTRIERRVQALRTLARDLSTTRHELREVLSDLAPPPAITKLESELADQTTHLSQISASLLDELESLRRTVAELQRGLTRIRMQTARTLFQHMARALRAVSRAVGSRVELHTHGEDTEFDKTVAEQITDPLIQLLRNAVVHGIEPPGERVLAGKPATGRVTLSARQDSGQLIIELEDDGRGIDSDAMRQRFIERNIWTPERAAIATNEDVLAALFDAGVSGRDDQDELAGRGIGLDLVRESVARLGGSVRFTSKLGQGTTFTLRLPMSTAVMQATLFKVAGQVYAVPHVHVVDTVSVAPAVTAMPFRHEAITVLRLERCLTVTGIPISEGERPGLVIDYAGRRLVATVDKIVGLREIIVKPLPSLLAPLTLYTGATVSASGKVQLILDSAELVRMAYPGATWSDDSLSHLPTATGLTGRALAIDDSRAVREAMTSMLSREGWIVDVASDGKRALTMMEQLRYDLVITDLDMPVLDGFALITQLRRDPKHAQVPILIVTSKISGETKRRAAELGVHHVIAKPLTRRKLLEAIAARGQ